MNAASPGIDQRMWELFGVSSRHFWPATSPPAPSACPTGASKLHGPDRTSHVYRQSTQAHLDSASPHGPSLPLWPHDLMATPFPQPQPEPLSLPRVIQNTRSYCFGFPLTVWLKAEESSYTKPIKKKKDHARLTSHFPFFLFLQGQLTLSGHR